MNKYRVVPVALYHAGRLHLAVAAARTQVRREYSSRVKLAKRTVYAIPGRGASSPGIVNCLLWRPGGNSLAFPGAVLPSLRVAEPASWSGCAHFVAAEITNSLRDACMLSAEEVAHFKREGWLLLRGVLDPALVERAIDDVWSTAMPTMRRDEPASWCVCVCVSVSVSVCLCVRVRVARFPPFLISSHTYAGNSSRRAGGEQRRSTVACRMRHRGTCAMRGCDGSSASRRSRTGCSTWWRATHVCQGRCGSCWGRSSPQLAPAACTPHARASRALAAGLRQRIVRRLSGRRIAATMLARRPSSEAKGSTLTDFR